MPSVRCDLCQRLKYETPLMHPRVRHRQRWKFDHRTAKKQHVNINRSWALVLATLASHALFKRENRRHQLSRHLLGIKLDGTVQEPRLCPDIDRFSFVKRRNRNYVSELSQLRDRDAQTFFSITEVGAE